MSDNHNSRRRFLTQALLASAAAAMPGFLFANGHKPSGFSAAEKVNLA